MSSNQGKGKQEKWNSNAKLWLHWYTTPQNEKALAIDIDEK